MLIATYGIRDIHMALMSRMENDYHYLKKVMEKEEKKVKPVEPKKEIVEENILEENVEVEEVKKEEEKEKKYRDPKEMKVWQKEQEEKKRKENEAKGIKAKDLLTKENLQKWYGEEGRTFSYISREYVGCKDTEVSAAVKLYNIESTRKNLVVHHAMKKK
jgi:delta 1-pyrroline-5-carboxylate dehydrogenase